MTTKTTKPKAGVLYVCVESFANNDFSVAAGQRLRGDNPIVQRVPDRFVPADTPDDEIRARRAALEAPPPRPEPIGRVKLRVLPGQGVGTRWDPGIPQTVFHRGRQYLSGQTLEASGADAQHLLDVGAVEIVRHLRPKKQAEPKLAAPAPGLTTTGREPA